MVLINTAYPFIHLLIHRAALLGLVWFSPNTLSLVSRVRGFRESQEIE